MAVAVAAAVAMAVAVSRNHGPMTTHLVPQLDGFRIGGRVVEPLGQFDFQHVRVVLPAVGKAPRVAHVHVTRALDQVFEYRAGELFEHFFQGCEALGLWVRERPRGEGWVGG